MENEKVISAIVKDNKIYGITDEGSLTVFDEDLNKWVQRCESEVLCADKTSALRKTFIDPKSDRPVFTPGGIILAPKRKTIWHDPMFRIVLVAVLAVCVGFLIKHL